jgi:hypothetical protein
MTLIADLIRAGVDPDLVQRVHDEIAGARAEGLASKGSVRSKHAEAQARYRDKKASQVITNNHSDHDVIDKVPSPPSPSSFPPIPPLLTTPIPPHPPISVERERANEIDAEFHGDFWPKYPHKVGKPDARKAFARCRKRHDLAAILDGLAAYVAGKPQDRPWLNPSTFLNQERFNDRPANVEARAGPSQQRSILSRMALGEFFDEPDPNHASQSPASAPNSGGCGFVGDVPERSGAEGAGAVVDLRRTGSGWG